MNAFVPAPVPRTVTASAGRAPPVSVPPDPVPHEPPAPVPQGYPGHLGEHPGIAPAAALWRAGAGQHPVHPRPAPAAAGHAVVDPGLPVRTGAQCGLLLPVRAPQAQAPQRAPRAGAAPGRPSWPPPAPAAARHAGLAPLAAGPGPGGHRMRQRPAPAGGAAGDSGGRGCHLCDHRSGHAGGTAPHPRGVLHFQGGRDRHALARPADGEGTGRREGAHAGGRRGLAPLPADELLAAAAGGRGRGTGVQSAEGRAVPAQHGELPQSPQDRGHRRARGFHRRHQHRPDRIGPLHRGQCLA